MRLSAAITSALLTLATASVLSGQRPVATNSAAVLTQAQALADFDLLRHSIEAAHGAPYRYATKTELDRRFDAHRQEISGPMSRREFLAVIAEMVAELRDGHARVEYDAATIATLMGARLFPLRLQLEGSRLVVVLNDSPADNTILPAMEVASINGNAVPAILARILPKIPADGFMETGKRTRLGRMFAPLYWLFVDTSEVFVITARRTSGELVTTTLVGVLAVDREKSTNPVNIAMRTAATRLDGAPDNIALTFPSTDIARLRIRAFDGPQFTSQLDTAFRTLQERRTKALILDLRGNGGGDDDYGADLVSRFTGAPFRYFDRIHLATIHPSFATWKASTFDELKAGTIADPGGGYLATTTLHQGVGVQQPASTPFTGELFVLMDGGTFSTSADVTAALSVMKRATFLGEETAGAYEGNTSGLNALIELPNSGLRLKIMMFGYYNAVTPREKGRGTLPDHVVERRAADVLNAVDAPLERAVALARAKLDKH